MSQVHFVNLELVRKTPDGRLYTVSDAPGITIKDALNFSQDFRVIKDSTIASSASRPTIKEYLELEAALSFEPKLITQTFIVTWKP